MREIVCPGSPGAMLRRAVVLAAIVAAMFWSFRVHIAQAKSIFDDDTPSAPNPVPSRPAEPARRSRLLRQLQRLAKRR